MLCRLFLFIFLTVLTAHAADLPPYMQTALAGFNPAIPVDLAYTITTLRDTESSVERYDPSLPEDQQWTLLQHNQRPATAEENHRFRSYRISTSTSTHATFKRSDIDIASLRLISENEDRSEYHATFREDVNDPMLHHLELLLTVAKHPAMIERFVLTLTGPYSPVLTVKMLELRVETSLNPPTGELPALPGHVDSRFRGRVFLFKSIEEDVHTTYSDFARKVIPPLVPPVNQP